MGRIFDIIQWTDVTKIKVDIWIINMSDVQKNRLITSSVSTTQTFLNKYENKTLLYFSLYYLSCTSVQFLLGGLNICDCNCM